ncbi:peptidyl-prolyl cis-trans isomerase [Streptomyces inusitatus]|uniref:Peptidyl-prolyl cis-trans isomerase n=1 Tax=Streptomyces inusitatus TaxID=68221 RepID=A0A918QRW8_9ACTN|nr:peptidylprolyl isomerase [Streptomyces inusitatus]GGZ62699.1 peptidyl-prolyl cis-trans isomerase [Streptomyces inusitatus]
MVSSDQRRRQLAREKFERQHQRRMQSRKRKQRNQVIAAAVAMVLAAAGAAFATGAFSDDGKDKDKVTQAGKASESPAPTPSEAKSPEPAMSIDKKAAYSMKLTTNRGPVNIAMEASKTPRTVNSFNALAGKGYFDGTKCHRLTTDGIFVLQCGDPKGDGSGGPGYNIPDENLSGLGKPGGDGTVTFPAGTVAMANTSQPNTGGSQFFLVYKETKLPPSYTPFGKMDAASLKTVEKIAKAGVTGGGADGPPKNAVTVEKATVTKR